MSTVFLTRIRSNRQGRWSEMWHTMDDLPDKSGPFLVRFIDGTIAFESFSVKHSCFTTNKDIVFWTDDFVAPDNDCMDCPKAHWQSHFGVMCYTCDTAYCTAVEPDDPFC